MTSEAIPSPGAMARRPMTCRCALVVLAALATLCSREHGEQPARPDAASLAAGAKGSELERTDADARAAVELGPIRIEPLEHVEPPVFVMRGGPHGAEQLVFLHGMCGHGLGYAQSFQFSAARRGRLIAPQGDLPCGKGPWASWSADLEALDQRIVSAFRALGEERPNNVLIIGYSQGATRAAALARRHPERYSRLILIGAPAAPSPARLAHLRGAVMMAGERDRQDLMTAAARSFRAANIPATYIVIPEAAHGAMGPTPERTMAEALDWLWKNSRPAAEAGFG